MISLSNSKILYNIEYKLIKPQKISDKKLIIFDELIYYTEYKTDLSIHQKGKYFKIKKNVEDFQVLKNIFDSVWN